MSDKRLLILSCSARKSDERVCTAIYRYNSPAFYVARKWLDEAGEGAIDRTRIFILSARYGLISATHTTRIYDERLTEISAAEKKDDFTRQAFALHEIVFGREKVSKVFYHLPKLYEFVIEKYLSALSETTVVEFATGAPGVKLKQLKNWLEC